MFKRLKQKIEYNEGANTQDNSISSKNDDGRRSFNRTSNLSSTNLKKTDSVSSLNSCDDMQATESTSKEDLYSMLLSRTTQVKRLEVKLAEFGQSLKERSRECDKLSSTLEKQQDSALRKLNELTETNAKEKKYFETTISQLEESEKELTTNVESFQKENESLKKRIEIFEEEKSDFNHQKKEFYEKRDNNEELHDLQKQELAKLKHMLMNSEKEVKRLQGELDENIAGLMQSREQNDQLERELRQALATTEATKHAMNDTVAENEKLSQDLLETESQKNKLLIESADYKDKLSSLAVDLQKNRNNLSTVETSHNKLIDKYELLKHNSEAVLDKAQSDLEEKETSITHLKNKLNMMEQRSSAQNLPQDEQVQALVNERLSLEQKLEESHQQLINIKSTWSDKINHLETQLSHLNTKIAEDCEEISQKNIELDKVKKEMYEKVESLTSQLNEGKQENSDLIAHNETILQQIAEAEAKLIEQKTLSDMTVSKHKKREEDMEEKMREIEKDLRKKIEDLSEKLSQSTKQMQCFKEEKENSMKTAEQNILNLEQEISGLQDTIEKKNTEIASREKINNEIAISLEEVRRDRDGVKRSRDEMIEESGSHKEKHVQAHARIDALTAELNKLKDDLQASDERTQRVSSELEEAKLQLDEKHQGLLQSRGTSDEKEAQLKVLTDQVSELETRLENRTTELISCKEEIADLKNSQSEENEELKRLRTDRSRLEDRILEKERSLKLHQQRLNDIKKTLQKEMSKKQQGSSSQSGSNPSAKPVDGEVAPSYNGLEPESNPIPSLLSGDMSLDDPSLSDGQRDVVVKYLKHVVLTFLSSGQSEALQLIRAISAILKFTPDEETLVREVLQYRGSWFSRGSRPNSKNVIKSSVKGKGRQYR